MDWLVSNDYQTRGNRDLLQREQKIVTRVWASNMLRAVQRFAEKFRHNQTVGRDSRQLWGTLSEFIQRWARALRQAR